MRSFFCSFFCYTLILQVPRSSSRLWACEHGIAHFAAWMLSRGASVKVGLQRAAATPFDLIVFRCFEQMMEDLVYPLMKALLAAVGAFPGVWFVCGFVLAAFKAPGDVPAAADPTPAPFSATVSDPLDNIERLSAASHDRGSLRQQQREALWALVSLHRTLGDDVWRRDIAPRLVAAGHAEASAAAFSSLLRPEALRIGGVTMSGGGGSGVGDGGAELAREDWSDVRRLVAALVMVLTRDGTVLAKRFSEHCARGDIMPGMISAIFVAIRAETQFLASGAAAATAAAAPAAATAVGESRPMAESDNLRGSSAAYVLGILKLLQLVLPDHPSTVKAAALIHPAGGVPTTLAMIETLMGMEANDLMLDSMTRAVSFLGKFLLTIPRLPTDAAPPDADNFVAAGRRTTLRLACFWRPIVVSAGSAAHDVANRLKVIRTKACDAMGVYMLIIGPSAFGRCGTREPDLERAAFVVACRALVRAAGGAVVESDRSVDIGACADVELSTVDAALLLLSLFLPGDDTPVVDADRAVNIGVAAAVSKVRCSGLCGQKA